MHRSPSVEKAAKRSKNPFSQKAEVLNNPHKKKLEKNSLPRAGQKFEGKWGNKLTEITFW